MAMDTQPMWVKDKPIYTLDSTCSELYRFSATADAEGDEQVQ